MGFKPQSPALLLLLTQLATTTWNLWRHRLDKDFWLIQHHRLKSMRQKYDLHLDMSASIFKNGHAIN